MVIVQNLSVLHSQVMQIDNAYVYASSQAKIYVAGSVNNASNSTLVIWGDDTNSDALITVENDFINNANCTLDGKLFLNGNWYNNSNFESITGHVYLQGGIQELGGSSISNFHHLTLNGTDFKFQSNHQTSNGNLNLNERELRTESYTFSMLNPASNAVTRQATSETSGGMVSSLNGGFFQRATNSVNSYLFPVGSSLPIYRYRPVTITPTGTTSTNYDVRFAPVDATLENYDLQNTLDTYCALNTSYYHQIGATESAPATISISVLPSEDGSWQGVSRWQLQTIPGWSIIPNTTNGVNGSYTDFTIANWPNFTAKPYILHRPAPLASMTGAYSVCEGESVQIPINVQGSAPYLLEITDNAGNSFTETISVVPATITLSPNASTTYTVSSVEDSECVNNDLTNDFADVSVTPLPVIDVNWNTLSGNAPLTVQAQNQTTPSTAFSWDFGNGQTSTLGSPSVVYSSEGSYTIQLVAENNGCFINQTWNINVFESPFELFVPNVFTINNDNVNEQWGIQVKGAVSSEVIILNRWGNVMHVLKELNETWDGKVNGQTATDGVYYYKYKILDKNNKEFTGHGHFTLISNGME